MKRVFTLLPFVWLLALFFVPFLIVLKISLSDAALSIPPYTPTLDLGGGWDAVKDFWSDLDFESYQFLTSDDLYWKAYLSSLKIAGISTLLTLLVGYPLAYGMSRAPENWRGGLMLLIILPFWTSFLIRVYAWMGILANKGLVNQSLMWLGVIDAPLAIINTSLAVYIGIVYTYLPFMVLPIYAALERLDDDLLEAAEDLGCSRLQAFWTITVPLSRTGVLAGCFLVFIPAMGEFVIPSLLGGSDTLMIGKVLWEEFFSNRDWPIAGAVAIVLLMILIVPIGVISTPVDPRDRLMKRLSVFNVASLTFGLAFLYLPMLILIIYSFNASKLVTVWGGFSTKWYGTLWQNQAFLDAAWVTVKVAFVSSTIATILGTMAAYALVRRGRFFGRSLFTGMIYAPLVMPEVITGLSLLLLFIAVGLDRGLLTIILAHTTFAMCFVSVVVSSRLVSFDRSLEEAALDLGCTGFEAFRLVTLPIIAPAVFAGWLLAFTLSLDDLVIASFTAGPASTTLPIKIFSSVRLGVSPEINALATIIICVVTLGIIVASLVSKRGRLKV